MKKTILELAVIAALVSVSVGFGHYGGYHLGYRRGRIAILEAIIHSKTNGGWQPKIGDRVSTRIQSDGSTGGLRIITITNVVNVGKGSQSGFLVYATGLQNGIDSSWVHPEP